MFIIPILRMNNFQAQIFVDPFYLMKFLVHVLSGCFEIKVFNLTQFVS